MRGPTLHLICGKIAAGKSTLAAHLAAAPNTVLISEDKWLKALFGDQMTSVSDYVRCSQKLRDIMGPHVSDLLQNEASVVLDFPANTLETRSWMRQIIKSSGAAHQMHVLDRSDKVCIQRLHARNAGSNHPFAATEAQFNQISKHIVLPTEDEGFNLIHHGQD